VKDDIFMKPLSRTYVFFILLFFGALLLIGINMNEVSSVWEKAAKICLSCIGIG
jgi:hypothetical protein